MYHKFTAFLTIEPIFYPNAAVAIINDEFGAILNNDITLLDINCHFSLL
jgi:hypothetical protein